jgi:hypothetical protein
MTVLVSADFTASFTGAVDDFKVFPSEDKTALPEPI